jgi:hypothetical protein
MDDAFHACFPLDVPNFRSASREDRLSRGGCEASGTGGLPQLKDPDAAMTEIMPPMTQKSPAGSNRLLHMRAGPQSNQHSCNAKLHLHFGEIRLFEASNIIETIRHGVADDALRAGR